MIMMTFLLTFGFLMFLKNRSPMWIATLLTIFLSLFFFISLSAKKYSLVSNAHFLISGFLVMTYLSHSWNFQIKRKFFHIPLGFFPLALLIFEFFSKSSLDKYAFAFALLGLIAGFLFDIFFPLPFGFRTYSELKQYDNYVKNGKSNISAIIKLVEKNPSNFQTSREILKYVTSTGESCVKFDLSLQQILFFWTQHKSFNSLHPFVKLFNNIQFDFYKKGLMIFDLTEQDLPLIHKMLDSGCWKLGVFILDQFLTGNKQSSKYMPTLIFADKFISDLKRVSFEDESIEQWLLKYSENFKGTPLSQKISMLYHNKDDWFQPNVKYAVI